MLGIAGYRAGRPVVSKHAGPPVNVFGVKIVKTEPVTRFVSGVDLNRSFYEALVGPILQGRGHAAGLLGWGSDVLGFDDERSTDHGWGLRLHVFVAEVDVDDTRERIDLSLPDTFQGRPVRYGWDAVPVKHHVIVLTLKDWLAEQLGFEVSNGALTTDQWLLAPQQRLLGITAGGVFHDDSGELSQVRSRLAQFPDDVWVWMLAAQWQRIAEEEAFLGRTTEVGDLLGSRIVSARLARELMRLWFLLHRTYWPYEKWFGSAFSRLPNSASLGNALSVMTSAGDPDEVQRAFAVGLETAAKKHNEIAPTAEVDPRVRSYHSRPFQVLMAERFVEACLAKVDEPALKTAPLIGSVDQWIDSAPILEHPRRTARAAGLYDW